MIRKSSNDPGDFSKRRAGHSRPALQALVYSSLHHHHSQLLLVMWIRTEAFELVQPVWVAHRMSFADFRAPPRNTIAANNAKGQPLRGKVIFWVRDQTMQLLYKRKVTPRCEKLSCVNIDEELHSLIRNSLGRVNKKKREKWFYSTENRNRENQRASKEHCGKFRGIEASMDDNDEYDTLNMLQTYLTSTPLSAGKKRRDWSRNPFSPHR
jgi:hypothetical protein